MAVIMVSDACSGWDRVVAPTGVEVHTDSALTV